MARAAPQDVWRKAGLGDERIVLHSVESPIQYLQHLLLPKKSLLFYKLNDQRRVISPDLQSHLCFSRFFYLLRIIASFFCCHVAVHRPVIDAVAETLPARLGMNEGVYLKCAKIEVNCALPVYATALTDSPAQSLQPSRQLRLSRFRKSRSRGIVRSRLMTQEARS